MLARQVMTEPVISVAPDTPVSKVAAILLRNRISGAPVVAADGRVVGIVSEGDLLRRVEETEGGKRHGSWWLDAFTLPDTLAARFVKAHGRRAEDVMTRDVVSVSENTPVSKVASILEERRIKRVPVLREGRLVGLVSRANLLHGLAALGSLPAAASDGTDDDMRSAIMRHLTDQPWFNPGAISVIVNEGIVELWGGVDANAERLAIAAAASEVAGVREVRNRIAVTPRIAYYGA